MPYNLSMTAAACFLQAHLLPAGFISLVSEVTAALAIPNSTSCNLGDMPKSPCLQLELDPSLNLDQM